MINKMLSKPIYFSITIFVLFYLLALWQTWFGSAIPCLFLALAPIGVMLLEKLFLNLSKKWSFFSKIKNPLIWLFIIFFQIGIGGIFTIVFSAYGVRDITEPWAYQYAKDRTSCQECIEHFPQKIPKEAKNVKLRQWVSHFGSEELVLLFDIDKNYIDKEIKKHKYQKIIEPYANMDKERMLLPSSPDDAKLFVITNKPGSLHHFPIIYGIGKTNNTKILYFYSRPDY